MTLAPTGPKLTKRYETDVRHRTNMLLGAAKRRAAKRGLPVTITTDEILAVIEAGNCELTGLPFVLETNCAWNSHPMAPSIDRIDANRGYVPGNVMVVCMGINQLKSQYPFHIVRVLAKAYLNATAGEHSSWTQ